MTASSSAGHVRRRVGHRVGQGDLLAERQADRPRQRQLLFRRGVLRIHQPLPLVLPLHFGPHRIDRRDQAGLAAIVGERGERIGGLHLGAHRGDAAVGGEHLEIEVGHRHDHEVARVAIGVLGGFQVVIRLAQVLPPCGVDDRLRHREAGIEDVEGTDDRGNAREAGEAERREIDDFTLGAEASRDVRQHPGHRAPAIAARLLDAFLSRDDAEVVLEAPPDRVGERQREGLRRLLARGHAAGKETAVGQPAGARHRGGHLCRCCRSECGDAQEDE